MQILEEYKALDSRQKIKGAFAIAAFMSPFALIPVKYLASEFSCVASPEKIMTVAGFSFAALHFSSYRILFK